MKKSLILLFGLMIAEVAVWAIPREVKKDLPGIEKSIQLKIEVVKNQVTSIVTIIDAGESPGQLIQHNSFNTIEQIAEETIALPVDYPYSNWRTQNYQSKNYLIKGAQHKIHRQSFLRC